MQEPTEEEDEAVEAALDPARGRLTRFFAIADRDQVGTMFVIEDGRLLGEAGRRRTRGKPDAPSLLSWSACLLDTRDGSLVKRTSATKHYAIE